MRRRLTLALLGTVTAALVVAGIGTLVLSSIGSRADTEQELRSQAEGLVALVRTSPGQPGPIPPRDRLRRLIVGLDLEGIDFVFISPEGRVVGPLPESVAPTEAELDQVAGGGTVSGHHGGLVFAMAGLAGRRGTLVAVLTRQVDATPDPAVRWFALSAAITVLATLLVAIALSRALTEPLLRAGTATRRIAAGDLGARVPEPAGSRGGELGDLARSVNAMAAALERSRGLERQFLLSVSHDLRTPLTSIRGWAEAITDGAAPDAKAAAGVIRTEAARLERLVGDLLDLARIDARRFALDLRPQPVAAVVSAAAEGFRPESDGAGVRLEVESPGAGRDLAAIDADRLAQVVANLTENALKYAATVVRVATTADDHGVAVVVSDDGAGIPAEDLPHVFERLYVAGHRPVRKESGSGLGLAIVRELVAAMGGTVTVESPTGVAGGTRFTARFPRVVEPVASA